MRRREFIALLGGATAAWLLAARAQQARADPAPIKIAVFNFELDDFSSGAGIAGDNAADVTQLDRATSDARRLIAESGRYTFGWFRRQIRDGIVSFLFAHEVSKPWQALHRIRSRLVGHRTASIRR